MSGFALDFTRYALAQITLPGRSAALSRGAIEASNQWRIVASSETEMSTPADSFSRIQPFAGLGRAALLIAGPPVPIERFGAAALQADGETKSALCDLKQNGAGVYE